MENKTKKKKKHNLQIPATEAGIDAAAALQREDGINVNLTFVSGVMHAAACAQAGAVAVTLSIEKVCLSFFFIILECGTQNVDAAEILLSVQMREWRRTIGQDIVESEEESSRAAGVEGIVQTIAAYFEMHGFSSTTGLIASEMDHVRTIYVLCLSPLPRLEPSSARNKKRSRADNAPFSPSRLLSFSGLSFFLCIFSYFLWAWARRWTMHAR